MSGELKGGERSRAATECAWIEKTDKLTEGERERERLTKGGGERRQADKWERDRQMENQADREIGSDRQR